MDLPPFLQKIVPGEIADDPPLMSLIAANLLAVAFAVIGNWDLATVLFIYWAQSVIIGIFACITLLTSDTTILGAELGKAQAEAGGSPVVGKGYVRLYTFILAGFFALHYGLFHWGYYAVIVDSGLFGPVEVGSFGVVASCLIFFANHAYSWYYHTKDQRRDSKFFTRQFFEPYNRIIPMHLIIIFGAVIVTFLSLAGIDATLPVLVLFLLMKTYLDVRMHLRKHYEKLHPDAPEMIVGF
jgi:hypothetical protein